MSIEKAKSQRENDVYENKPDEDHCSEQHCYQDEEGGPTCFMRKDSEGGVADKRKVEGERNVRRSVDTETGTAAVKSAKGNAKVNRKTEADAPRANTDTKVATTTGTAVTIRGGARTCAVRGHLQCFRTQMKEIESWQRAGVGVLETSRDSPWFVSARTSSECWLRKRWMRSRTASNMASEAVEIVNRDERRCMQSYAVCGALNIAVQKRHDARQNVKDDDKNSKSASMSSKSKVMSTRTRKVLQGHTMNEVGRMRAEKQPGRRP